MIKIRERCFCGGEIEVAGEVLATVERVYEDWKAIHTGPGHSRQGVTPPYDSTATLPVQR